MAVLGAVTIGQSPRDDVLPEISCLLPDHVEIIERGALDCLGFGRSSQRLAREATGVPVVLPRMALAGALAALL